MRSRLYTPFRPIFDFILFFHRTPSDQYKKTAFCHILPSIGAKSRFFPFHHVADQYKTVEFQEDYPLHLNFILKDFKEDDTGLEYIGARNQQMGDGGVILQLTDTASGQVIAVSHTDWACTVIHTAPLDKSCEREASPLAGTAPFAFTDLGEPDGWKSVDFDDSNWTAATAYSAQAVGPKDGYDEIHWDASAQIIWGPDLETDNTILRRVTVNAP